MGTHDKNLIYISKVETYDQAVMDKVVFEMLDGLGISEELHPGMRVTIKPNLLLPRKPESNATTNPAVIRAICNWLRAKGINDITLADSPGGPYVKAHMNTLYSTCGIRTLSDVLTVNEDYEWQTVQTKGEGFVCKEFNLINPIVNADYIINVAKLKTHSITKITAGVKNLFGTIPGLQKPELHIRFPEIKDFTNMLVELCETVQPNLTIIDAIESMEGEGPNGGTTKKTGLLFGSQNVYAQDYVAAKFMGLDPSEVNFLNHAKEKGLLTPENELVFMGDGVEKAGIPQNFELPEACKSLFLNWAPTFIRVPLNALAAVFLKPLPNLMAEKCVGCGKCAQNCPAHIIVMENKRPVFTQKKKCISCFCCQEMCPEKAIEVKRRLKR